MAAGPLPTFAATFHGILHRCSTFALATAQRERCERMLDVPTTVLQDTVQVQVFGDRGDVARIVDISGFALATGTTLLRTQ